MCNGRVPWFPIQEAMFCKENTTSCCVPGVLGPWGKRLDIYIYIINHPLTKMYVKGGRGRGCNIHCTRVRFYYWGISSIQFSEGGGSFFWMLEGEGCSIHYFDPHLAYIKGPLCEPPPSLYFPQDLPGIFGKSRSCWQIPELLHNPGEMACVLQNHW